MKGGFSNMLHVGIVLLTMAERSASIEIEYVTE